VKLFIVLTDTEALGTLERAFVADGTRGFTILPSLVGLGRTGLKTGTRVHPGATGLLMTAVPDGEAAATERFLLEAREAAGAREATKVFVIEGREVG
jgi:hypothetical protein